MKDVRRLVPRTDDLLSRPDLVELTARMGRERVKSAIRVAQEMCREGTIPPQAVESEAVRLLGSPSTSLTPVINATGVVVHTNLGRAPLSEAAKAAMLMAADCVDVELDLETGERGRRGRQALAALLDAVPAAEDVLAVNNCAAALCLVAATFATGREIVLARGEMVEIGDGFRIHEILESAGARLREVGTTNRVRPEDYWAALGEDTGFVLKVHPSNFWVEGFTSSVEVEDLGAVSVPVVVDVGSGLLTPHKRLPDEPDVTSQLDRGANLVVSSGDKLLGGPQCGLIFGDKELIDRLRRHPFARALRMDKLRFAALEATVVGRETPVGVALESTVDHLDARARRIVSMLGTHVASFERSLARVGGGGAPDVALPSAAISVSVELALRLRLGRPAVVGRVHSGRLLLDLIAVKQDDDDRLISAIDAAIRSQAGGH